jgi:hypothetical protein
MMKAAMVFLSANITSQVVPSCLLSRNIFQTSKSYHSDSPIKSDYFSGQAEKLQAWQVT